ncbi:MAG TPA: aromatic ring-hydroxylating dioxygenase subunit alpha, partial [Phycisphaerae bacterium]|nr:aromatic ring-hydroxylating dioxygenase subunit alpha [Phycisphaerae bacterium]
MSNQWVQDNGARVQRRIFSDAQIHQDELERVFGRSWLFLAHETQLKKAGDYLTTFMGETPVIVIRQEDGSISAFLNACTHRGMLLSAAEGGCAKSFTCPYHGWVFGADGSLRDIRPEGEHGYGPE